jgi:hypothetical protein
MMMLVVKRLLRIEFERWVLVHIVPNIQSLRPGRFQEDLPCFEANTAIFCNNSCGDILGPRRLLLLLLLLLLLPPEMWIQSSLAAMEMAVEMIEQLLLVMKVGSSSMTEE